MGASESKLAFKEEVFRLAREDNIAVESPTWAQFYQLPETAEDVFALWSPNDLRSLTLTPPPTSSTTQQIPPKKNLETLIYTCIARLHALQTRRCYSDPHQPIAPEVLNCIRILTRLLPYIYEADHLAEWEDKFFWRPRKPQRIAVRGRWFDGLDPRRKLSGKDSRKEQRAENSDDEDDGADGGEAGDEVLGPPLGEHLIDVLVRYMFFPNFTLPKKVDGEGLPELKAGWHIWTSGIGCRQSVGMTKENERNAAEVIRLLLSLCSRQMYLPPHMVAETDTKPLTYLTTKPERQVVLSMICSLLNTILKYNPASWRVPIDFTIEGDPRTRLVNLSLQLLLVLVLYPDPTGEANQYRKSISRLHRVEDFQFIQQGLTTVLTQPVSGISLPGLPRSAPWSPEMLILFWELLQVNKRFRAFIIETDRAHDFVVLVLYYAMLNKDEPAKQGMVRMCVLILQTMSVEAAFGERLNKGFVGQESLPALMRIKNFHGSYADFLVTTIHTLMTTTQGRLESIYPALLAIINNIAPYVQNLQRATSSKLMDLFAQISSAQFLLEKESNHVLLASLLQAMNAILEHQYSANRRFVEVVLRNRKRFQALRDFTVEGAISELDRQAQDRKDRGENVLSPVSPRNSSIDSIRSPSFAQSPRLGNVPENGSFALASDDDDDEHDGEDLTRSDTFSPTTNVLEDAVPMQSRSMSEKARGKQPVGQGSFSRSSSRNASIASLPALLTAPTLSHGALQQQFVPSAQWLETWLPHLQLHTLLSLIEGGPLPSLPPATPAGIPPRDLSPLPRPTTLRINSEIAPPQSQAFIWTPLSLGWYISLLWGLVYASDIATHKGINGIWTGTGIRLFNVVSGVAGSGNGISLRSPRGAVDYVGDSIAKRIGSLSLGGGGKEGAGGGERET